MDQIVEWAKELQSLAQAGLFYGHDIYDKVRMEAPEIFRVLGKRRPEFVRPYVERLRQISETDDNCVVRIHCLGAVKATELKF